MVSACRDSLPPLLLRQLDLHPPGVLDGVDLDEADPALVDTLLAARILIEAPPLTELSGSWSDDDGLPAVVRRVGDRFMAFSPTGSRAPFEVDGRELIQYTIDLMALSRAFRTDNGLDGTGPEQLSPWAVLLGNRPMATESPPVVLCRLLTNSNALDTIHALKGRLAVPAMILLTPTERPLGVDTVNAVRAAGTTLIAADTALDGSPERPFRLRLGPAATPMDARDADLLIDRSQHLAFYLGQPLGLQPREFLLLVLLAERVAGGGTVHRNDIYRTLYRDIGAQTDLVYDEQITIAVSRLRSVLDVAAVGAKRARGTGSRLIETKRSVGYRLRLDPTLVKVV